MPHSSPQHDAPNSAPIEPQTAQSPDSGTKSLPDLSGYDRNVRSAKVLDGILGAEKDSPITDADRRANNPFHDPNAEPFTLIEKWVYRACKLIVALTCVGFVALVVAVIRKLAS